MSVMELVKTGLAQTKFVPGEEYVCRRNAGLRRKIVSITGDLVNYVDQSDRISACSLRSFRIWFEADRY